MEIELKHDKTLDEDLKYNLITYNREDLYLTFKLCIDADDDIEICAQIFDKDKFIGELISRGIVAYEEYDKIIIEKGDHEMYIRFYGDEAGDGAVFANCINSQDRIIIDHSGWHSIHSKLFVNGNHIHIESINGFICAGIMDVYVEHTNYNQWIFKSRNNIINATIYNDNTVYEGELIMDDSSDMVTKYVFGKVGIRLPHSIKFNGRRIAITSLNVNINNCYHGFVGIRVNGVPIFSKQYSCNNFEAFYAELEKDLPGDVSLSGNIITIGSDGSNIEVSLRGGLWNVLCVEYDGAEAILYHTQPDIKVAFGNYARTSDMMEINDKFGQYILPEDNCYHSEIYIYIYSRNARISNNDYSFRITFRNI